MKEVGLNVGFSNMIKSPLVEQISNENLDYVTRTNDYTVNTLNMNKNKNNKTKYIVLALILLIIILAVVLIIIFSSKKEKEETIYDVAYKNLDFKEDTSLKKVYCSANESNGTEVKDTKVMIYYFNGNKLDTYIYHNDIILSNSYMDYYDEMYSRYEESLKNDYDYNNVKTGIEKGENEILVTVITYNKSGDKSLGMPKFVNADDAKQKAIADGYTCK